MSTDTIPFVPMRPDVIALETNVGRVVVKAKFENLGDKFSASQGRLAAEDVRTVEVENALVDTGCTLVGLPTRYIERLGLEPAYRRHVRTSTGIHEATVYRAITLTIQGRDCSTDVLEVPDGIPPLIGQVPLEQLDFVIDPKAQALIGNPEHGGEHILEAY